VNQTRIVAPNGQSAATWGTIALGESRVQVRHIVVLLGVLLWLLPIFISTGVNGIAWLAFNLAFLIILIVVTSFVRTAPLHKLAICFLAGGLMTGIDLGLTLPLTKMMGANFPLRHFITVPLEELLKLSAVAFIIWKGRRFSSWTLGATDVLLMGAAAGAGFGFVEDSFIHAIQKTALNNISVLIPTSEMIGSRVVCGHAVWTALTAGAAGIALLLSHAKRIAIPVALIGLAISIMDHLALNYGTYAGGIVWLQNILNTVAINGYLALCLFVFVLLSAIICDLAITMKNLPSTKEFKLPRRKDRHEPLSALWDCILDLRRLNYSYYRYRHYQKSDLPAPLALTVAVLAKRLVNRYMAAEPAVGAATIFYDGATGERLPGPVDPANVFIPANIEKEDPATKDIIAESNNKAGGISVFDRRPLKDLIDLPDRYKIIEEVFKGGMGIVFRAKHTQTRANLAIKVLHPHLATDSNYLLRFEQEAKAASQLQHPNIVTVFDFGVTPNSVAYLVMEWLEGPSLEKVIKLSGPMSAQRFISIFRPTANALAHAHRKGVVHRDIKPSNIILTVSDVSADNPKIVDFGIAKILTEDHSDKMELTTAGDVLGSPFFMSPEQCSGGKIDYRSDIYSLGCVMYEALCGVPPHTASNPLQVFAKHLNEMPKQPRTINPAIIRPELFEPMLFKCLQKSPDKRFGSMEELEQELKIIEDSLRRS